MLGSCAPLINLEAANAQDPSTNRSGIGTFDPAYAGNVITEPVF